MGARRFLRWAALSALILIGAEVAARVWIGVRAPEEALHAWGHSHLPRAASNYVPDPFTGFALNPDFSEHSEQGFRERDVLPREHEGIRIVALGGSNTYGTQVPIDVSFPRLLELALHEQGTTED